MILMIAIYSCPKQLKSGAKCCLGINPVMVSMDVFQSITVQAAASGEDHACKLCNEKHPTGLHGFKPKNEGVKQDIGNNENK